MTKELLTFKESIHKQYLEKRLGIIMPDPLTMGEFVKITLIRSKNKPQTAPSAAEYPITGGNASDGGGGGSSGKWYAEN